jgi:iron complex transport system substrate-binding protein
MRAWPTGHTAMKNNVVRLGLVVAATCFAAFGAGGAERVTVKDAAGRSVTIADSSRIVSIGGSVTEILYALDLEDRIVAVDTTSLYPLRAFAEKRNVGYMRQLSPEGVLGLAPSLVLAAEGAGPKGTIEVLEAASIPFVLVPDRFTGEGIVEKIRLIAQATGSAERGACLAKSVEADLGALAALRARIVQPRKVLFILSFTNGRPMVAGRATAADGILTLAGASNAVTDYDGYKLLNDESVIAARPDAVLVMERASFRLEAQTVFEHPAFAVTPAAAQKALISMEGLYLLGFGPRAARAARDLALALYPSLDAPSAGALLPSERPSAERACAP